MFNKHLIYFQTPRKRKNKESGYYFLSLLFFAIERLPLSNDRQIKKRIKVFENMFKESSYLPNMLTCVDISNLFLFHNTIIKMWKNASRRHCAINAFSSWDIRMSDFEVYSVLLITMLAAKSNGKRKVIYSYWVSNRPRSCRRSKIWVVV